MKIHLLQNVIFYKVTKINFHGIPVFYRLYFENSLHTLTNIIVKIPFLNDQNLPGDNTLNFIKLSVFYFLFLHKNVHFLLSMLENTEN